MNDPYRLAALPLRLIPGEAIPGDAPRSTLRTPLLVAWACVLLALGSGAGLLGGVLALAEKRRMFVSSVTHELRTPLTTLQVYSEMLASGMVPDEVRKQEYLVTLHGEADRLTRLVENVLAYARLENNHATLPREPLTAGDLIHRMQPRLAERAARGQLLLNVTGDPGWESLRLSTNPVAVEQIIGNLVDNAARYAAAKNGSSNPLHLHIATLGRAVAIRVRDHGPGLPPGFQPFHPFATGREREAQQGIGLGLALSHRLAHELGGALEVSPTDGAGCTFMLQLPTA